MLTIAGPGGRYCDGFSRRSFLKIGGLALGGLSMPEILRAESASDLRSSKKAVIMVLLPGGPPHLDMYDLKPDAPAEIRGEFKPIATRVPGIDICELMPRLAASMDRFVPVRSLVGGLNDHNLHQCLTGWESHPRQDDSRDIPGYPEGGWPSIGSVVSKLMGPVDPAVPPFLSLAPSKAESTTRASLNQSGYLGAAFAGYEPLKAAESGLVLPGITLDRLSDRRSLLESLDLFRRRADVSREEVALDGYTSQAFDMLTSSRISEAMDLSREDPKVRERYGIPTEAESVNGGAKHLEGFLMARRLVDAGVRCVTLAFSQWPLERESRGGHNWDWHFDNFSKARKTLPMLDRGIVALVEDLAASGRLDDVSIVVWGEFGRSPRINGSAGRDHWPQVGGALLAGGGIRAGQVLGATNPMGEHAVDRPIHYRDVFATLYHNLGIDAASTFLQDRSDRPHNLVDGRKPIPELI
ncbi:DUF1501 domain-containing protein [Tundrisphaera lichenicola]|uniref:DUF1501 domain-containing protein n=1 Tax=Tundrisphaera lichenicola TaxID=2029860 RepID=UPI003EC0F062